MLSDSFLQPSVGYEAGGRCKEAAPEERLNHRKWLNIKRVVGHSEDIGVAA
jgi:hypothetical protein